MKTQTKFKKEDTWLGVFWQNREYEFHAWICIIPCLPIHISWNKYRKDEPRQWKCGHTVKPSELAQHVKDHHMGRATN